MFVIAKMLQVAQHDITLPWFTLRRMVLSDEGVAKALCTHLSAIAIVNVWGPEGFHRREFEEGKPSSVSNSWNQDESRPSPRSPSFVQDMLETPKPSQDLALSKSVVFFPLLDAFPEDCVDHLLRCVQRCLSVAQVGPELSCGDILATPSNDIYGV